MKRVAVLSFFFSGLVYASYSNLNSDFTSLVKQTKIGDLKEQGYCYADRTGVKGYQPQKLLRIASITKLLTTYLASETLNLHKTYVTKVYVGKDSIHIEGSRDPYFEQDKLLLLMKALNDLGYTSFKRVTFNKDFLFYDITLDEYALISPQHTKSRLSVFLRPGNSKFVRSQWNMTRKFAKEEGISLDNKTPALTASVVALTEVNPLLNENPAVFVHESKPLHSLLKTMNVQSKNLVAENVYIAGSQIKTLPVLFQEKGINSNTFKIHNGSGLPIISKENRIDNFATCETVLKTISLLSSSLKFRHNLKLSDVVAVNGGKDLGSFRTRFESFPETHESVISKTGTLKHTSSLAGALLIGSEVPFAILNHTTNPAAARKFQDRFVAKMFDHMGPATPEQYTKISIFPWIESDFLKPSR